MIAVLMAGCPYQEALVNLLLTSGARPGLQDRRGATPLLLHCSSALPCPKVTSLLLQETPPSVDTPDSAGDTPLHKLATSGALSRHACLSLLLREGAQPQTLNQLGSTPLMLATARQDLKSAALLTMATPLLSCSSGLCPLASLSSLPSLLLPLNSH